MCVFLCMYVCDEDICMKFSSLISVYLYLCVCVCVCVCACACSLCAITLISCTAAYLLIPSYMQTNL